MIFTHSFRSFRLAAASCMVLAWSLTATVVPTMAQADDETIFKVRALREVAEAEAEIEAEEFDVIPPGETLYLGHTLVAPDHGVPTYPEHWSPYAEKRQAMADAYPGVTFFVQSGTVSPVGGGFFEEHVRTSWAIQAGGRAPITNPHCPVVCFGEIAGSFMGNDGGGPAEITSGTLLDRTANQAFFLNDFRETRLTALRRGSLQTAIGWWWTPQTAANRGWRKLQFNTRLGTRWGHAHARYTQDSTASLDALVASRIAAGSAPQSLALSDGVKRSDIFFGLFAGVGVATTWEHVCWGFCHFRTVSLTANVEYSHEWMSFGEYGGDDNGLSTIVPTLGLSVSY